MNRLSPNLQSRLQPGGHDTRLLRGEVPERTPIIRQYLRIFLRWRYIIIAAVATCAILGVVVSLLMTPKYTAVSTIEIARESDKVTNFQGVEREASAADQEF